MKKNNIIILFLMGGCVGIALVRISYIVANILMGTIDQEVIESIKSFGLTFIWGGICYTIASLSIQKVEKKDVKSIERQKILKKQIKGLSVIVVWFVIFLIRYILKKDTLGIILALSFIIVFSIWVYGYLLAYLNLKNNMAMIKKKN